jgi:hypothetical protein
MSNEQLFTANTVCHPLLIEPVPKLSPCFETGPFLTKCEKTEKKHGFFHPN